MKRLERYEKIFTQCIKQSKVFEKWDQEKNWSSFHHSHYDWWAFPIDKPSRGHGTEYQVGEKERQILYKQNEFIHALRNNAVFVSRSWGWNLQKGEYYEKVDKDQVWQNWPIRLSKMCRSLEIFNQRDLFKNSILHGVKLLETEKKFVFGREDLTPYFLEKYKQMKNQEENKSIRVDSSQGSIIKDQDKNLSDTKAQNNQNNQNNFQAEAVAKPGFRKSTQMGNKGNSNITNNSKNKFSTKKNSFESQKGDSKIQVQSRLCPCF